MFLPLLLFLSVTYPKEKKKKMKENDFFFFFLEKLWYVWVIPAALPQGYEYPKNI
jgi:hypothetical protein